MSKKVYDIVHSLSKSEKRYINLRVKDNSIYKQLITTLEKQKEYNGELLIQQFSEESFAKHIRVSLNDLYLFILKNLREYHAETSIEFKVRNIISNIEILFNKGHYKETLRELKKGIGICQQYELFSYYNILIDWERKVNRIYQSSVMDAKYILEEWKRKDDIIENEKIFNDIWKISMQAFNLYLSANIEFKKYIPKQLYKLISHKAWKEALNKKLYRPLLLHNNVNIFYYQLINDKEKTTYYSLKHVEKLEENIPFIKSEPSMYIISKANSISIAIDSGEVDRAVSFMNQFDKILDKFSIRQGESSYALVIQYKYFLDLKLKNIYGEFEKSTLLSEKYKDDIKRNTHKIGELSLMKIYYEMAYAYYGNDELKKALNYLNKILLTKDFTLGLNTYHINLLLLIVHYELKNFDVVATLAKKLYKIINSKSGQLNKIEIILINLLKLILKKGVLTKDFLQITLQQLKKTKGDYLLKSVYDNFDLLSWIESQITKKQFSILVKEKYREGKEI